MLQYEVHITILQCLLVFFADASIRRRFLPFQLYVRTLDFAKIHIMIFSLCDSLWMDSDQSVMMHFNYLGIISMRNHVGKTRCHADGVSE